MDVDDCNSGSTNTDDSTPNANSQHSTTAAAAAATTSTDAPSSIQQRLVDGIAAAASVAGHHATVQAALIATLTAIVTDPRALVHEHVLITAVRSTFHMYLVTTKACKSTARTALRDMVQAVWGRMERATTTTTTNSTNSPFPSQHHADAFHLLRSLCKVSSKELQADNLEEPNAAKPATRILQTLLPTLDPTELHSKLLALELIVTALEYDGENNGIGSEKFVQLMQTYLCGSLLKNCVSNNTRVAFLSQKIFLALVRACERTTQQYTTYSVLTHSLSRVYRRSTNAKAT